LPVESELSSRLSSLSSCASRAAAEKPKPECAGGYSKCLGGGDIGVAKSTSSRLASEYMDVILSRSANQLLIGVAWCFYAYA
jgi:hypothetical protein